MHGSGTLRQSSCTPPLPATRDLRHSADAHIPLPSGSFWETPDTFPKQSAALRRIAAHAAETTPTQSLRPTLLPGCPASPPHADISAPFLCFRSIPISTPPLSPAS